MKHLEEPLARRESNEQKASRRSSPRSPASKPEEPLLVSIQAHDQY